MNERNVQIKVCCWKGRGHGREALVSSYAELCKFENEHHDSRESPHYYDLRNRPIVWLTGQTFGQLDGPWITLPD